MDKLNVRNSTFVSVHSKDVGGVFSISRTTSVNFTNCIFMDNNFNTKAGGVI